MNAQERFQVGSEVTVHVLARFAPAYLISDGQRGVVVTSFAPHDGRNVELADGRIINVSLWDLKAQS
jgi:hypothetical protein